MRFRSPAVRFVKLEDGTEFTLACDALVWVDGEAREAGAVTDPDTLVRIRGESAGRGFLATLAQNTHRRITGAGVEPASPAGPVHYYELRGALIAPAPVERPRTVPSSDDCPPVAAPRRKGPRIRGTVVLSHGPGWTSIKWPVDATKMTRALALGALPASANVDRAGVLIRYLAGDRHSVVNELTGALSDIGFAVSSASGL